MKTPRLSRRASRLFAVLMRDQFDALEDLHGWKRQADYFTFLRSQSKRGYAGCAYRLAISMIEGRA